MCWTLQQRAKERTSGHSKCWTARDFGVRWLRSLRKEAGSGRMPRGRHGHSGPGGRDQMYYSTRRTMPGDRKLVCAGRSNQADLRYAASSDDESKAKAARIWLQGLQRLQNSQPLRRTVSRLRRNSCKSRTQRQHPPKTASSTSENLTTASRRRSNCRCCEDHSALSLCPAWRSHWRSSISIPASLR